MPEEKRIPLRTEEYRSATTNAGLALGAAGLVAPFVAPKVYSVMSKVTSSKKSEPKVVIPPGQIRPRKD
jgi:hypothetical protein